ncbi:MAG: hypothetical protein AAF449_15590, partial [Myxococcota bacterium]
DDEDDGSDWFWENFPRHEVDGRTINGYNAANLAAYLAGNGNGHHNSTNGVTDVHAALAHYLIERFAGNDGYIEDGDETDALKSFLRSVVRDGGFYLPD